MPGVARQLLTFFASPKKVSKERRPLGRSPFGVPGVGRCKSGREKTRCAQTVFPSFSDLHPPPPATLKRQFHTGSLRIASGRARVLTVFSFFAQSFRVGAQRRQYVRVMRRGHWVPASLGPGLRGTQRTVESGKAKRAGQEVPLESSWCWWVQIGKRRENCLSVASFFPSRFVP